MRSFLAKTSATVTDYVLALATLGGVTQIGSFLFVQCHPRWSKQVQLSVAVARVIALKFANGNAALKRKNIQMKFHCDDQTRI